MSTARIAIIAIITICALASCDQTPPECADRLYPFPTDTGTVLINARGDVIRRFDEIKAASSRHSFMNMTDHIVVGRNAEGAWFILDGTGMTPLPPGEPSSFFTRDAAGDIVIAMATPNLSLDAFDAGVWIFENDQWRRLPNLTGLYMAPTDELNPASDEDGRWGYVDDALNFVIEPKWRLACPFRGDHAFVRGPDGQWGVIDRSGREIVRPRYLGGFEFSEGVAAVMVQANPQRFTYITPTGEEAFPGQSFIYAGNFQHGLAPVRDIESELCGYIDLTGEWVIDPAYDVALEFNSGLAVVTVDDRNAVIDTSGRIAFKLPEDRRIRSFDGCLFTMVRRGTNVIVEYRDRKGSIIHD